MVRQRSERADAIVERLIVQCGMSYAGAIRTCELEADRIVKDAERKAAPYREVVAELRAELEKSA